LHTSSCSPLPLRCVCLSPAPCVSLPCPYVDLFRALSLSLSLALSLSLSLSLSVSVSQLGISVALPALFLPSLLFFDPQASTNPLHNSQAQTDSLRLQPRENEGRAFSTVRLVSALVFIFLTTLVPVFVLSFGHRGSDHWKPLAIVALFCNLFFAPFVACCCWLARLCCDHTATSAHRSSQVRKRERIIFRFPLGCFLSFLLCFSFASALTRSLPLSLSCSSVCARLSLSSLWLCTRTRSCVSS